MKQTLILIIGIAIVNIMGCSKSYNECEEPSYVETYSGLLFEIKDSTTNRYVFNETFPVYNVDSFEIWDNQGANHKIYKHLNVDTTTPPKKEFYYDVTTYGIYNSNFDKNLYIDTIKKDLYLIYKRGIIDTISISFKANTKQCGSEFSFLKVIYKNKIISNTTTEYRPRVHFTRY